MDALLRIDRFGYDRPHHQVLARLMDAPQINHKKNVAITAALAFLGALQPTPVPFAGIHKFYLGQYGWGLVYIILGATQLPRIACAVEGIWYLSSSPLTSLWVKIGRPFTPETLANSNLGETVDAVANGLREIEQLRQEGLLSEYEFEQKRRNLLEQMP